MGKINHWSYCRPEQELLEMECHASILSGSAMSSTSQEFQTGGSLDESFN